MSRWLALLALIAGCGPATSDLMRLRDLSSSPEDLVSVPEDAGGAAPDLAARDLANPYVPGGLCGPKVNEILTGVSGGGRYEFIEIHNPCGSAVDLAQWTLVYRSATNVNARDGNDSVTLYQWSTGATIPSSGFLLYAGPDFPGNANGTLMGLGLADSGAIGIRDASARIADSVAYGAVEAAHGFIETSPAPMPLKVSAPGSSIGRRPDGRDTEDNSLDFTTGAATPGVTNG